MGALRKAGSWLGIGSGDVDDDLYRTGAGAYETGTYDAEDDDTGSRWVYDDEPEESRSRALEGSVVPASEVFAARAAATETPARPSTRIAVVHPKSYHEARAIGEYFRQDIPVVIDLTAMDESDAKRVVDFASGLTFGRRGAIERLAKRVFLLMPADARLLTGDPSQQNHDGFFNQA
ncbi:cell division protein SepF [Embleya sp. NPDC001921]